MRGNGTELDILNVIKPVVVCACVLSFGNFMCLYVGKLINSREGEKERSEQRKKK